MAAANRTEPNIPRIGPKVEDQTNRRKVDRRQDHPITPVAFSERMPELLCTSGSRVVGEFTGPPNKALKLTDPPPGVASRHLLGRGGRQVPRHHALRRAGSLA